MEEKTNRRLTSVPFVQCACIQYMDRFEAVFYQENIGTKDLPCRHVDGPDNIFMGPFSLPDNSFYLMRGSSGGRRGGPVFIATWESINQFPLYYQQAFSVLSPHT